MKLWEKVLYTFGMVTGLGLITYGVLPRKTDNPQNVINIEKDSLFRQKEFFDDIQLLDEIEYPQKELKKIPPAHLHRMRNCEVVL